ncbi:MAG: serine hydrolase [Patescibacteria group bacterium]
MKKIIALIAIFGLFAPFSYALAEAEFNSSMIITDEDMQNCAGWTANDVQTFLQDKGSYLANYKCEDVSGTIKSAAEIIYDAAQAYTISPKFLLVTLQKEQSLVTDESPTQKQLDWATGFAVCDGCYLSDPKVVKYKGFAKQVDGAAGIIRWYYDNKSTKSYIKQKGAAVYIDNTEVVPQSWATAFLYTYTPHLHGNKNFWRLWNTWFAGLYPNGTVVTNASSTNYWLIQNGKKRLFTSKSVLVSRADPKMAITLSETDLNNYENGTNIAFSNYSLLKAPSGYFLVDYDMIRPFASADVVSKIGYNPQEVVDVSDNDLFGYTLGPAINASTTAPQGEIYKITDLNNSLYLHKNDILYPITDSSLLKTNFANLSIINKTKKDIANLSVANNPIVFTDGALLKVKDTNRLYVVENGKKRRISDEQTFLAMGYKKTNLVEISALTAFTVPDGEALYISNALASSEYLGDSESVVEDLFKTKLPAYLVAEYPTGRILAGKNIDTKRSIASLTKILVAYEALNQDFNLKKSTTYNSKLHTAYNNPLSLINGEKILNKDLLYTSLVASVNNASRMMGASSGLTEKSFISAINTRLEQWGADNTTITDTTGLDDDNISTPRDVLKIFITALKNSTIKDAMSDVTYSFKEVLNKNKIVTHNLKNTNDLMQNSKKTYRILASKTGYTDEAGAVLVMLIESKTTKEQYVIITMGNGSANRFVEPNKLALWAISPSSTASIANVK